MIVFIQVYQLFHKNINMSVLLTYKHFFLNLINVVFKILYNIRESYFVVRSSTVA